MCYEATATKGIILHLHAAAAATADCVQRLAW